MTIHTRKLTLDTVIDWRIEALAKHYQKICNRANTEATLSAMRRAIIDSSGYRFPHHEASPQQIQQDIIKSLRAYKRLTRDVGKFGHQLYISPFNFDRMCGFDSVKMATVIWAYRFEILSDKEIYRAGEDFYHHRTHDLQWYGLTCRVSKQRPGLIKRMPEHPEVSRLTRRCFFKGQEPR